jgi:WD40 repeat protein
MLYFEVYLEGDSGSGVKVWNMETYECINKLPEEMHNFDKMICLKDGKIVGCISKGVNVIIVFNLESNEEEYRFSECLSFINCLELMSNNETLISGHIDGVRIWDMNNVKLIKTIASELPIWHVKLIQNESYLLVNTGDCELFLCDFNNETENQLDIPINKENEKILNLCALLPNENLVVINGACIDIYESLLKKN